MRPSPTIEAAILERVLLQYPQLGELKNITHNGLSRNHSACLFESRAGTFFAKGYDLRWSDASALKGEHAIIRHLNAATYPTPHLHLNASSETLTWIDEAPFALFDVAKGEDRYGSAPVFAPFASVPEAGSAGEHLGKLHLALASMTAPSPRSFIGLTAQYRLIAAPSIRDGIETLFESAKHLKGFVADRPDFPWLLERMEGYRDRMYPHWLECRRGHIHGDFIKRNLLWDGPQVASVLDFDCWNEGAWVYDLALALLPCGFNWPKLFAGSKTVNQQDLSAFLEGYQSVNPLNTAEREILPDVMESARCEFYLSAIAGSLARKDEVQAEQFWTLLVRVFRFFASSDSWSRRF